MFKLPLAFALLLSLQLVAAGDTARLAHQPNVASSPGAPSPQLDYCDNGGTCPDNSFCCNDYYGGCCPDGSYCTEGSNTCSYY
ncbi:hypothetical protein OG21DRAFT_1492277 [Imleria badia]|nr:hypothetical protein OG21DRAFT_1492277 [Imleria badia]